MNSRGQEKELKVSVTTDWLNSRLRSTHLAILDARTRRSYVKSHILGAVHADLFHYFVPGTDRKGLQKFQKDLARLLGNLGLTGKETVVVYENRFGMRAARVGWMLEYAGAHKVFLLEGGYQAWHKSHFPAEKGLANPTHRTFQMRPVSRILASANQIRSDRSSIVLDVRTEGEFTGREGRECDKRRGRIPHARWLEWTNFVQDEERFKTRAEISNVLKAKGLSKKRSVVVTYCHRGARAAAAYYALRSLGYRNVRNYVGSWHEWSARERLPLEK